MASLALAVASVTAGGASASYLTGAFAAASFSGTASVPSALALASVAAVSAAFAASSSFLVSSAFFAPSFSAADAPSPPMSASLPSLKAYSSALIFPAAICFLYWSSSHLLMKNLYFILYSTVLTDLLVSLVSSSSSSEPAR